MGHDKRGVSAKFLQRELAGAYQTAWTIAHKLRHGLSEDPARPLRGFLEADETFIGGRSDPTSRGRSTASPDKSLVVAAVEKVPGLKNKKGKHGHAAKGQHGFFAGNARIAVLPAATGAELGASDRKRRRRVAPPDGRCYQRSAGGFWRFSICRFRQMATGIETRIPMMITLITVVCKLEEN